MIKKINLDGRILDVIPSDQFEKNINNLNPGYSAIEEDGVIYPIRNKTDNKPGLYIGKVFSTYKEPGKLDKEYGANNAIDFNNLSNMKDAINTQNKLRKMEKSILTTKDNIFYPPIHENDAQEMLALKQAIIAKKIDIDRYEHRFGDNFNNDKRLFKDNTITMYKLKTICSALDIKVSLILEDTNEEVPNPIGKSIKVDLIGGDE